MTAGPTLVCIRSAEVLLSEFRRGAYEPRVDDRFAQYTLLRSSQLDEDRGVSVEMGNGEEAAVAWFIGEGCWLRWGHRTGARVHAGGASFTMLLPWS